MPVDEDLELDTEQAPPPKKRSVTKIIVWSVVGLLLVGGATAGGLYFAGMLPGFSAQEGGADGVEASKDSKKKGAKGKGDKKKAKGPEKPILYQALEPPFVVNFQDQSQVRFLQISVEVSARDVLVMEAVKTHTPVIRSNLILLLSSQSYSDISTREGKENLRASALAEINKILVERTGQGGIEDVYFTSFVMQ